MKDQQNWYSSIQTNQGKEWKENYQYLECKNWYNYRHWRLWRDNLKNISIHFLKTDEMYQFHDRHKVLNLSLFLSNLKSCLNLHSPHEIWCATSFHMFISVLYVLLWWGMDFIHFRCIHLYNFIFSLLLHTFINI